MSERITSFITKLIFYPLIFLFTYGLIILLGEKVVVRLMEFDKYNLWIFILVTIVSSILAFCFTLIFHIIINHCKQSFKNWFHYSHIILGYFSGLISTLITIEPVLKREKIIRQINYEFLTAVFILFLVVSNYSLYKIIIFNDEFKIKEKIKVIVSKYKTILLK